MSAAARGHPRIATLVIFVTILLDFMGFSILVPVLPVVLGEMGADAVDIGVVLALYVIALVLFLPVWGWISDRIGRRPVLAVCLLGTAGAFALMAVAQSIWIFYVARILAGFFGASVGTAQAYMTDITSEEDRARGIGLVGAASAAGVIFGPAVGGLLLSVNESLPFWAPVALALAACLGTVFFLPESRAPTPEQTGWRGLAGTLIPTPIVVFFISDESRTRLYLYLFLHVFVGFAVLEGMFPLYAAKRFAWDAFEVGGFLSLVAIVLALTQLWAVPRLSESVGEVWTSTAGLAAAGLGMVLLGQTHSLAMLVVAGFAIAVGNGLWFSTFTSLFSKSCGSVEESGEYMARSVAMSQTGRGLGIILGGMAHHYLGVGWEFLLGGLSVLAALAITLAGLPVLVPARLR